MEIQVWQALIDGKKAQDALKACRKHISDIIAEWYRGHTNRPCNPDTLHTVFYQILDDAGINLDELWS